MSLKDLPQITEWESNSYPLCPFQVDEENPIEESGSHVLQVSFTSKKMGGAVLGGGCGEEEFKFCVRPELLVTQLIMEPMADNEAIIVTVSFSGSFTSSQDFKEILFMTLFYF